MRSDTRRYVIAYDIPDDRRRMELAKAIHAYGDRVQYSVFVVDAAPLKLARLRRTLERIIIPQQDSIIICDLGLRRGVEVDRYTTLGRERRMPSQEAYVV